MALSQCAFSLFLSLLLPQSLVYRVKRSRSTNQANTQSLALRGVTGAATDPKMLAPPSLRVAAFTWPSASNLRGQVRSGAVIAWLVPHILTRHVKDDGVTVADLQGVDREFWEKVKEWAEASGYDFHEVGTDPEAPRRDILLTQKEDSSKKKLLWVYGDSWSSCQIRRVPDAAGTLNILAGHGLSDQAILKQYQVDIFLADENRRRYWSHDGVLLQKYCVKKREGRTPCIYIAPNHYFAPGTQNYGYIHSGPVQGVVAEVVLGPGS